MKNILLSLLFVLSFTILAGQVSKTIHLTNAGTLSTELSSEELNLVTNLTITGNIDARDFKTMRDMMPVLAEIDLSGADIVAYSGDQGTESDVENDYLVKEIPKYAFLNPASGISKTYMTQIVLQSDLLSISYGAFYGCTGLTAIEIPANVTEIKNGAFEGCLNLNTIKCLAINPPDLNGVVFSGVNRSTCILQVPQNSKSAYQAAGEWQLFLNIVEMEGTNGSKTVNLTTAGTLSTVLSSSELASITKLTITGNIDARDFKTMRDLMPVLAEIDLSGANIVEYSGTGGTDGDSSFMTFNAANTIPSRSFSANPPFSYSAKTTLTKVILPSSVTAIKREAFSSCSSLRTFNFPSSLSRIENYSFMGCSSLENIQLSSAVILIGLNAFSLVEANINVDNSNPNYSSVDGVLYNKDQTILIQCPTSKTGSFSIPSSVTKIGTRAFYYCTGLTSIDIPSSVEIFENGNIWNCGAFYACSGLTTINIPVSVTEIGRETFAECINISSIYVNSSSPVDLSSSPEVFTNINKLNTKLYVPAGTKAAYQAADQWKDFQNIVEMEGTSGSKTVNLTTAGTLSTVLSSSDLASITKLTITGYIDARDFKTMRDLMPLLAEIDLIGATIVGYEGLEGSSKSGNTIYPNNTVPENAFESKPTLKNIILPNSTEEIAQRAFLYCRQLLSATLPSSLLKINDQAFGWCNSLSLILLPESLTYIGYNAFATTNLTEINIPQAVDYIGDVVFFQCRKLLSINVSALNEKYSSFDGVLFNKDQTILIAYPGGKTSLDYTFPSSVKKVAVRSFEGSKLSKINLPDGILDVGFEAFTNMYGLKEIIIPSSISKIEAGAFAYNANVISISVDRAIPLAFGGSYGVFDGINKSSCKLYVPFGSKAAYQAANQWKDFQNIVEMEGTSGSKTINLTSPGTLASLLTDIELASVNNLTLTGTLDARDFKTMRDLMPALAVIDLSAVTIAEYTGTEGTAGTQLTTYPAHEVPRNALYNKISLTSMSIPVSATTIGRSAFNNCDGLTHVTFGANPQLKTVGYMSFAYCDALTEIQIPSGVTLIDYAAFRQCSALVTCNLPESVKTIGNTAFYQCTKLKNLSIPQAVETIGEFAFYLCKEVLSFNVPASAVLVGRGTFIGATGTVMVAENNPNYSSLDGVFYDKNKTRLIYCPPSTTGHFTIPATVTTIVVDAFYNCSLITSFDIPEGLATLEDWAFENCSGIAAFTLPASLTSIGNQAFYGCSGLTSIRVNNPVPVDLSAKTDVFSGIDKTACILYVPAGSKTAYQNAEKWKDFQNIVEQTYVPDDNFEQALINLGYDSGPLDDYVSTANISSVTILSLPSKNIADLKGIEGFLKLERLYLSDNKLTSLDISNNLFLKVLHCQNNLLTSLNVTKNTALTELAPNFNQLTGLDISNNPLLVKVFCQSNQITELNVDKNINLITLICGSNQLTSLNVSNNKALVYLACDNNKIESLDLSNNKSLTYVLCSKNKLNNLNIQNGNNANMIGSNKGIDATSNPNLFCIRVDNPVNSSANPQWLKDPQASYSTSCNNIPTANAGADQTIEEGSIVTLDGSLSSDADQDNLTFKWTASVGITLSSESAQKPTFVAPEVTQDTRFTFYLVVNDGFTDSPTDQVLVTVKQVNKAPVADAGADQTIEEGSTVTLDGSLSSDADGDNLTYKWTTPDGITLSSASAQKPTFIAPEVAEDTQFTFFLVVNDGFADSPADTIVVTVKQVNQLPVADAGADQTIEEGATVTLDGSLSSDANGDSITYKWIAPDGITLSSASVQKPTFVAPEVTEDTQFTFYLVVNDGFADSPADTIVVTVKQVNQLPVANAGADQKVKTGDKVVLNGSGSFDPDQDALVYFWTSLSGITLNSASDPSPFFLAPVTKNETDLIFTLTVSDGSALSKTDTVIITVENKSSVISVKTSFDGTVATPEQLRYELYQETNGSFTKVAAIFSTENNTTLFNVEAGNWIILAIPVDPETNFIPTYFGNGVTWDEAGIITVNGDEVIDLEINCRKTAIEPAGEYSIEGFVYQDEGTKSCVVLSNATGNNPVPGTKVLLLRENETTPVRTTFTDNDGKYIFSNLIPAEYNVIVDIPGFDQVDVWNIKLDSVVVSVVNVNFTVVTSLGVITDIPETEYKLAIYPNPTTGILHLETENWPQNSKAEVFNYDGRLVFQTLILNFSSVIDLSDKPDGVYILSISSNKNKETVKIVLRK